MSKSGKKSDASKDDVANEKRGTLRAIAALYELAAKDDSPKQWSISALEALSLCAHHLHNDTPKNLNQPEWRPPDDLPITIPFWVVRTLVYGWLRYKSAPAGKTVGECFGLEGGGQGKRPAKQKWDQQTRDLTAAVNVAMLRHAAIRNGERLSLEKAFMEVAEFFDVSPDTIERAWEVYGPQVMKNIEPSGA